MLKSLNHIRIVTGCITIFFCMLTASLVFAKGDEIITKKSFYRPVASNNEYVDKNIVDTIEKTTTSGITYDVQIVDGNVIQKNVNTNTSSKIYTKGDAKYLAEVNYYFDDACYILVTTEDGDLYANVYKNNEDKAEFRKINTNFDIDNLKVREKELGFYDYPDVSLFGQEQDGKWKEIKL